MRLSDIRGERVIDVIADIIEPVANIATDKEAMKLLGGVTPKEGQTAEDAVAERLKSTVPSLMRGHRDDLVRIFAALHGVGVEEYAESMTLSSVVGDVYDILTDQEFLGFLSSQK